MDLIKRIDNDARRPLPVHHHLSINSYYQTFKKLNGQAKAFQLQNNFAAAYFNYSRAAFLYFTVISKHNSFPMKQYQELKQEAQQVIRETIPLMETLKNKLLKEGQNQSQTNNHNNQPEVTRTATTGVGNTTGASASPSPVREVEGPGGPGGSVASPSSLSSLHSSLSASAIPHQSLNEQVNYNNIFPSTLRENHSTENNNNKNNNCNNDSIDLSIMDLPKNLKDRTGPGIRNNLNNKDKNKSIESDNNYNNDGNPISDFDISLYSRMSALGVTAFDLEDDKIIPDSIRDHLKNQKNFIDEEEIQRLEALGITPLTVPLPSDQNQNNDISNHINQESEEENELRRLQALGIQTLNFNLQTHDHQGQDLGLGQAKEQAQAQAQEQVQQGPGPRQESEKFTDFSKVSDENINTRADSFIKRENPISSSDSNPNSNTSNPYSYYSSPSSYSLSAVGNLPSVHSNVVSPSAPISYPQVQSTSSSFSNSEIRPIYLPTSIISRFSDIALENTRANRETCAILAGSLLPLKNQPNVNEKSSNGLIVTHVILPKQSGSANSCSIVDDEMELISIQMELDLLTLGWIHTHPTQSCFLSSVDMHTHYSYQVMMNEAIAIVLAPTAKPNYDVYQLTKPGMESLAKCKLRGFHEHRDTFPFFVRAPHVVWVDSNLQVLDKRN